MSPLPFLQVSPPGTVTWIFFALIRIVRQIFGKHFEDIQKALQEERIKEYREKGSFHCMVEES